MALGLVQVALRQQRRAEQESRGNELRKVIRQRRQTRDGRLEIAAADVQAGRVKPGDRRLRRPPLQFVQRFLGAAQVVQGQPGLQLPGDGLHLHGLAELALGVLECPRHGLVRVHRPAELELEASARKPGGRGGRLVVGDGREFCQRGVDFAPRGMRLGNSHARLHQRR